jgi:uncharacterized protein
MGKLLILILAIFVAYAAWGTLKRASKAPRGRNPARANGEKMVDCSQCGIHLPISEAVESHGRYFCSEDHQRLFNP